MKDWRRRLPSGSVFVLATDPLVGLWKEILRFRVVAPRWPAGLSKVTLRVPRGMYLA
jgi:hypothetical protein